MSAFGESAAALEQALLAEAETTKVLSSPNITNVFGARNIEGQFCAAMEYIQGNSIATMLARKEGFSIWDLLDIGRQLCSGLDHAKSHDIVHYSLEPSKIMCGWDGTVKILGFGVSSVGNFAHHVSGGVSSILHYTSPEQVQGQATDGRSNLFSLGAMFYEMVTERKAFDREDVESLRQGILESTPVAPVHVNPKVHPLLSDLIMKALAKDPARALPEWQGIARRSREMQRVETGDIQESRRHPRALGRLLRRVCRRKQNLWRLLHPSLPRHRRHRGNRRGPRVMYRLRPALKPAQRQQSSQLRGWRLPK